MLSRSTATTPAAAIGAIAAGIALALSGAWHTYPPITVSGLCVTVAASTMLALRLMKGWITDTSAERARIMQTAQQAETERLRYIAAEAALTAERDRMRRDMAFEVTRCEVLLKSERAKLRQQFDDERAALICETFESAFDMFQRGLHIAPARGSRAVIPFPMPATQAAEQPTRGLSHP